MAHTYQATATDADVTVTYGVNRIVQPLGGTSIRDIGSLLQQALNLPLEPTARVNGQIVTHDHVVRDGDEVEFLKPAGVKGVIA